MLSLNQYKSGALISLVLIAVVVASYYLGSMKHDDAKYQQQITQWKELASGALQRNAIINHTVDSLNNIVAKDKQVATAQTDAINQLRGRADSIRKARPEVTQVLSTLPDTCAPAKVVILSQEAELTTVRTEVVKLEQRDSTRVNTIHQLELAQSLLKIQNDSLRQVIIKVPVYHEPKILGIIPQPSRTFSFIGGILVGVSGAIVLSHQLK